MATSAGSGRKERLTVDNVFEVLKLTNREWQWVAKRILEISSNKCEDINRRYSTDDERLRQAIQFWLKRCAFASWRSLLYQFHRFKLDSLALRILGYTESILDDSLTSDKISAALDSMSDEDLGSFLVRHEDKRAELRRQSSTSEEYRILLINHWLNTFHTPTWEYLAGRCFLSKKEIPLRKTKEHFQRKPESSLTLENLTEIQSKVKDWDIVGLPMQLGIQNAMTKELEDAYPDPTQRTEAFIKMFLEEYPAPSWELVCRALYIKEEYNVLEEVQNKYYKGTSETRRHLQEAMKKGKGSTSITKVVLFGLPESGKTCTKHVILDEEPPQEYTSTPLALRPVTIYCVDITPGQWRKLSRRERDEIVATACQCYSSRRVEVKFLVDAAPSEEMQEEAPPTAPDTPSMRDPVEEPNVADMATPPHAAPMPTTGRAAPIRDAPKPKRQAAALYPSLQTQQNLLDCLDTIQVKDRVYKIKRVQISDCGGQPQFHEILPIFIRGTTLYLYVFKLNEALSNKPMIKYYDKGKPICDDYPGTETYEQILEHCLRVVRSQKATGEKLPQIMIIGTHKDKEHECKSETREDKNKKLSKLLLPEFRSEVKYYRQRPTREVIFPINARNPGAEEKKIAAEIRHLIEIDCEAEEVDTPLLWLGLEGLLEDLTEACGRDVILKSELFAAARSQLHIEDESALDAALRFLHEHNLVFYYPEILPDVVFANAQVLLNKVTELVRAAHKGMMSCTLQGELWQRFCDYALVSEAFLGKEEFQEHYIPNVFNHKHLMKLFNELLIFAPFSDTEVFVPAILKKLTKQELNKHRVASMSPCASLVLTFPDHGGPLLGVFCATVGALLSEDNIEPCRWKLTMDSEDEITPRCLKRNCVQFSIEGHPGTVTIIDSFQYIEVHIHLSPQGAAASIDDLPAFCKMIRRSFVQALRKATLALHYNYNEPVVGFGCSCGDPTFHLASISANKKLWMCKKGVYSNRLNKSQLMWLEDNEKVEEVVSLIESIPVLHELDLITSREKEIRVMRIVAPLWEKFSLRLQLRRETISTINKDNPQRAGDACQAMFNTWLNGEGRKPVSWGTLISALNEADLSEHAKVLGDIIGQK